jgi:hypothetical protein
MARLALVHPREQAHVAVMTLMAKCTLFQNKPALLSAPYRVESPIPAEVFRAFVSALNGRAVEITAANWASLSLLSEEFGFDSLAGDLTAFRPGPPVQAMPVIVYGDVRLRIADLEDRVLGWDREIRALAVRLSRWEANLGRLSSAVESLRAALETAESRTSAKATELELGHSRLQSESERLSSALESLRAEFSTQKAPPPPPQTPPTASHPPSPAAAKSAAPAKKIGRRAPVPVPAGFDSAIVPQKPALFAEFGGKRFTLLWRGSRDGFGAKDFHRRCDGHANTLTLIEDTGWNIFGGFTPVKWESIGGAKADPSLMSFLFTLKNPHNFPARKFALKADQKEMAICCFSTGGPHFCDIVVSDNCNANTLSFTYNFGDSYANDTGRDGTTFFTGSKWFKAKEVEVFEITD